MTRPVLDVRDLTKVYGTGEATTFIGTKGPGCT